MAGRRLVTFELFSVSAVRAPIALWRIASDRRRLRATPGLHFWKLLGTGDGRTFDLRDVDLRTWSLLCVWDTDEAAGDFADVSSVIAGWRRIAGEHWHAEMRPLASRGRWSRREPFGEFATRPWDGPVVAITRARLRPGKMRTFWRAVPPVVADLGVRRDLLLSVGIGEAPIGVQGTFSVWRSADALRGFAYQGAAHRQAIRRTATERWYAEELFARLALVRTSGTIWGGDPLHPRRG